MSNFSINLEELPDGVEQVHSLSKEELDNLQSQYEKLKYALENDNYELTIEDQKVILSWRRADRETKFILNKVKEKVVKEKVVRVKKPKKLSKKALGIILIKEMNNEEITEEENRNKHFTLTGEIL